MLAYVMLHRGDEVPEVMNPPVGWNTALSPVFSQPSKTQKNTLFFNTTPAYQTQNTLPLS